MIKRSWEKHLTVDKNIVRVLSASTYEDFPSAIRELVSNAYDADSTEVHITIDLEKDFIKIEDNGNGMSSDEFSFFLRIAGQERNLSTSPNFGRQRIGQFGIGFLAVFPFGKQIQLASTVRRSDIKFEATIPTERFLDKKGIIDVGDIPISGVEMQDAGFLNEHGLTLTISPLTEMVRRYFERTSTSKKRQQNVRVRDFPPMERLKWMLEEMLPIDYHEDSPHKEAFSDLETSGLRVSLNEKELFRNSPGVDILENETWKFEDIVCRYFIATDWKAILPYEERGLRQRLKNVGIGGRELFGLGTEGRTFSRLHWLTGEIRILDGFDNFLSIDRNKFVDSSEYDEFREYFRNRLAYFAHFVEDVSEAKRDIERKVSGSRVGQVGSREESINKNIKVLENKGFEIRKKSKGSLASGSSAIIIDEKQKTIEVAENHPSLSDQITIASEKYPIRYKKWDFQNDHRVARRSDDGIIEINEDYPLFKSRRYGEVFLRVLIILLLSSEDSKSLNDLQSDVANKLLEEFKDLT